MRNKYLLNMYKMKNNFWIYVEVKRKDKIDLAIDFRFTQTWPAHTGLQ